MAFAPSNSAGAILPSGVIVSLLAPPSPPPPNRSAVVESSLVVWILWIIGSGLVYAMVYAMTKALKFLWRSWIHASVAGSGAGSVEENTAASDDENTIEDGNDALGDEIVDENLEILRSRL